MILIKLINFFKLINLVIIEFFIFVNLVIKVGVLVFLLIFVNDFGNNLLWFIVKNICVVVYILEKIIVIRLIIVFVVIVLVIFFCFIIFII